MTVPSVIEAAAGVSPELMLNAISADPTQQPVVTLVEPPVTPAPVVDVTPDAIERARQQEKDKLYPRIEESTKRLAAMESEVAALRAEREARIAAETQAQAALEEAERTRKIAETSAKDLILQQQAAFDARFAALQAEREAEREVLAKEAEFNRLRAYTQEKVREHAEDIAPQFFDLITGNTQEEIDASIATMQAKTTEIYDKVMAAQTAQRSQMRGASPTSIPGAGTDDLSATRQLTAQQLKDMPMSEYAKYRPQLGVTGNPSTNKNRGLFD